MGSAGVLRAGRLYSTCAAWARAAGQGALAQRLAADSAKSAKVWLAAVDISDTTLQAQARACPLVFWGLAGSADDFAERLAMISALPSTTVPPPARSVTEPAASPRTPSLAPAAQTQALEVEGAESTVVTLSDAASRPPAADPAPTPTSAPAPAPAPASTATAEAPASLKPELAYEAADVDKDGKVSVLEQQVYDFRNPAVAAARAEANRVASSDLRAYEAVARAGRIV